MEVYCDACHEDVEHATRYKNKNHIVTCDKKNLPYIALKAFEGQGACHMDL